MSLTSTRQKIPNSLIEAYKGYHDCDEPTAIAKIEDDSSFDRLDVYLNWNGIIGFTGQIENVVNFSTPRAVES